MGAPPTRRGREPPSREERRQRVHVGSGQPVILDALRSDELEAVDLACQFTLFTVRIDASVASTPELVRARAIYDVWFEHEAGGRVTRSHAREERRHTDQVRIEFPDARSPAIGPRCEVVLSGAAFLYSRLRSDGAIDVAVSPFMSAGLAAQGGTPTLAVGAGSGVKRLRITNGEVVRFVIPSDLPGTLPAVGACKTRSGRVSLGELLEGSRTSLIVRVKRSDS